MRQHDRGQGFRAHVGDHKYDTDCRRDQNDVQTGTPVSQPKGKRGNKDYGKPTPRVSPEEGVHVAPENEFLEYTHCNKPQREVDPVPDRAFDLRHEGGKRLVTGKLVDQPVSILVHQRAGERYQEKCRQERWQGLAHQTQFRGGKVPVADEPQHNQQGKKLHAGVVYEQPPAPVLDVDVRKIVEVERAREQKQRDDVDHVLRLLLQISVCNRHDAFLFWCFSRPRNPGVLYFNAVGCRWPNAGVSKMGPASSGNDRVLKRPSANGRLGP